MTLPVCPVSIVLVFPVCVSHNRMVESLLALARVVPSGEKNTEMILPVCPVPVSKWIMTPVRASYSPIPALLANASQVPSGEYAISETRPRLRHPFAPSGNWTWSAWAVVRHSMEMIAAKNGRYFIM